MVGFKEPVPGSCLLLCTLGEEGLLEKKIFENQFYKYKKITKNILTVGKKFNNFSKKNDQHFLGANFFLQN